MWKLHIIDKIPCQTLNRPPKPPGFGFTGALTADVVTCVSHQVPFFPSADAGESCSHAAPSRFRGPRHRRRRETIECLRGKLRLNGGELSPGVFQGTLAPPTGGRWCCKDVMAYPKQNQTVYKIRFHNNWQKKLRIWL